MGANIGFATISVIPSFKGIDVKARAGLMVLTKIGKDVGEDTGKKFSKGFESKIDPDLKRAGTRAAKDFSRAVESSQTPDLTKQGVEAGKSFTDGVNSLPAPDLTPPGVDAGRRFASGIASGVKEKGKAALLIAGAAAAAIVGQAFLKGMETEVATDKLAAQLGGSDWAKGLGEVAGNLYLQGFGESVGDPAAAVRAVVQNGLLSEDATNAQIEKLSGQVLTFNDVLDQDLAPTIRAVATLLRTGLAGSAEEALDLLTRGIQQGADIGEDLLDTLNEYPTLFRELGLDGKKGLGLIIQGLKGGARNSDIVADALKEFGIRSKDASVLSIASFKAIGLNGAKMTRIFAKGGPEAAEGLQTVLDKLRGMEDPVARNAAAVGLFGTQSEDLGAALLALNPDTAVAGLGNVTGATDKLGTAYDNASSKIETFKRQALEKVTVFIAEEVIPRLQDFKQWVDENSGAAQILAGIVGGALLIAMTAYAVAALVAAAATIAATWPFWLFVAALAATVAAAYATAAAFQWAYEKVGWFRGAVNGVVGAVFNAIAFIGLLNDAIIKLARTVGKFTWGALNKVPGSGTSIIPGVDIPGVPFFDHGGVMPGRRGVHSLAMVAGGETILPTHKTRMSPMAGGAGDGMVIKNYMILDGKVVARNQKHLTRTGQAA